MDRWTLVSLSVCALLALLFYYVPAIDIAVAKFFFSPTEGFLFNDDNPSGLLQLLLQLLLKLITGSFVTICLGKLAINNIFRGHRLKAKLPSRASNRTLIYLLLALGLGPGLVVNGIFKDHWGRARPREVVEFGGDKQFTAAFVLSDQCEANCSFVSGEASIGFYGLAFMFVARRRWKTIVTASLLAGAFIGFVRMSLGAHFLSDIIFSGVFTYLVCYLLYLLLLRPTESIASRQATATETQKSPEKPA